MKLLARRYGVYATLLLGYAATAWATGLGLVGRWADYIAWTSIVWGASILLFACLRAVYCATLRRPFFTRDLTERLLGAALFVAGSYWMLDIMLAFKASIPGFTTYRWDPVFATVDAWLHFGRDPWQWLHGLHGIVMPILDALYVGWFATMAGVVLLMAFWASLDLRAQFFVAFVLCWMLGGTVGAIALASGGPVYFAEFAGDPVRFSPLLAAIEGTSAREIQRFLWGAYERRDGTFGGISAMPSMHVTVVALFSIAAWKIWRPLGLVMGLYAFSILIGSVYLGWHYAIDGYVGIGIAGGCWWLAGRLTRAGQDNEPSAVPIFEDPSRLRAAHATPPPELASP